MDKIIELPLVRQQHDTGDKDWADRTCGICSLEMILEGLGFKKNSVMDLVNEAVAMNGYIPKVGWKHSALAEVAKRHGLPMDFIVQFPKTPEEKMVYVKFILDKIKNGTPLLVSIYFQLDKKNSGHVAVVNGARFEGDEVLGFYIQDPSEYKGQHNYFLNIEEFLDNWRGGLIYPS